MDHGVIQIHLRLIDIRGGLLHGRGRIRHFGVGGSDVGSRLVLDDLRRVEVRRRDQLLARQRHRTSVLRSRIFVSRPGALETGQCMVQIRFGLTLGGPRLADCGVVQTDPAGRWLVGVYDRVEVGAQRVDDSDT
jgi:hypothetical protein